MAWRLTLIALLCPVVAASSRDASDIAKTLKVFTRDAGGITHFYVQNLEAATVTATFEVKMANLKASTNFPYTLTFPGNETVEAFTLAPVKKDAPWSYNYKNSFTLGSNTAVHDDNYVYSLPYEAGRTFRVTQGYHGGFSHTGPDEYAIDWKMSPGTPVLAARGGVVVKVKDDSEAGGPDRKFEGCANCIVIEHSDGTMGIYAHLMKGGSKVRVGDRVNAGDLIALSGNTGFTSGPHLHFSVFKTKSGTERASLPVKFKTASAAALTLGSGESYKAAGSEVRQAKVRLPLAAVTGTKRKG